MNTIVRGEIEWDAKRGVLYFHSYDNGGTFLRICGMPSTDPESVQSIDITLKTLPTESLKKIVGYTK